MEVCALITLSEGADDREAGPELLTKAFYSPLGYIDKLKKGGIEAHCKSETVDCGHS